MRRLKSFIWAIGAVLVIGMCWRVDLMAKIIASLFIISLALFNIFLGPAIDSIKDNVKKEIEKTDEYQES